MTVNSLLVFLLHIFLLDSLPDACAGLGSGGSFFNYGYEARMISTLDLMIPQSYGDFQITVDDTRDNGAPVLVLLHTVY